MWLHRCFANPAVLACSWLWTSQWITLNQTGWALPTENVKFVFLISSEDVIAKSFCKGSYSSTVSLWGLDRRKWSKTLGARYLLIDFWQSFATFWLFVCFFVYKQKKTNTVHKINEKGNLLTMISDKEEMGFGGIWVEGLWNTGRVTWHCVTLSECCSWKRRML